MNEPENRKTDLGTWGGRGRCVPHWEAAAVPLSCVGAGALCSVFSPRREGELYEHFSWPRRRTLSEAHGAHVGQGTWGQPVRPFLGQAAIETPCLAPRRQT